MKTIAILPIRRFVTAKQRLRNDLSCDDRQALASAMMHDVLLALSKAQRVDEVIVVSGERGLSELKGAIVVDDPHDSGHNAAVVIGVQVALQRGAGRVLIVPGDCPALDPLEVDSLLDDTSSSEREIVIVPDRHGCGTNALVLTPPDLVRPLYGPGSRERHERLGSLVGATVNTVHVPTLAMDVDTLDDLRALKRFFQLNTKGAAGTRRLLDAGGDRSDFGVESRTAAYSSETPQSKPTFASKRFESLLQLPFLCQ